MQPDLVIETIFVGNDAEEAVTSAPRLDGRGTAQVLQQSTRDAPSPAGPPQHGAAGAAPACDGCNRAALRE